MPVGIRNLRKHALEHVVPIPIVVLDCRKGMGRDQYGQKHDAGDMDILCHIEDPIEEQQFDPKHGTHETGH